MSELKIAGMQETDEAAAKLFEEKPAVPYPPYKVSPPAPPLPCGTQRCTSENPQASARTPPHSSPAALEQIYGYEPGVDGKPVKERLIYSFKLGEGKSTSFGTDTAS